MSLDQLIAPEIKDDEFYNLINALARQEQLRHVLEIGSSAGGGSTEAFVTGLKANPHQPKFYCLEVSKARYRELAHRYASCGFVRAYNASSVPAASFMTESEVRSFYTAHKTILNQYALDDVLSWHKDDLRYIAEAGVPSNGIEIIKADNTLSEFDLVLIDGSAFTGMAELRAVYGSKIIMLDDINDIKCLEAFETLKRDPHYVLEHVNWTLRNGFAVFRKRPLSKEKILPIHFFTTVLNGEPFIRHHIEVFKQLSLAWTWHIIEGVASISHDAAGSVAQGGKILDSLHKDGRSIDGTSEYLDTLAQQYPQNVKIYRKSAGQSWDDKVEMANAPLSSISEQSILVQIDCDELWTVEQLATLHRAFCENEQKTAAHFYCNYFVGSDRVICTRNTYGNNSSREWLRAWRFLPGSRWEAHESPKLHAPLVGGGTIDLASVNPFSHQETEAMGLVFEHYADVTEAQVRLKESYYGHHEAEKSWAALQQETNLPCRLASYLPWVTDGAQVATPAMLGIAPLARKTRDNRWHFRSKQRTRALPAEVVVIRTDLIGDAILFSSFLPELREHYPDSKITMVCQDVVAPVWEQSPYLDRVLPFKKDEVVASPAELERLVRAIASLRPDVVINPMWSPDALSHVLSLSVSAGCRIAFKGDAANILAQEQSKVLPLYSVIAESVSTQVLELNRYRDLLVALGRKDRELRVTYIPTNEELRKARTIIQENGLELDKLMVVVPTAGVTIPRRNYARIDEVVSQAAQQLGLQVLVLGSAKDKEIGERLLELISTRGISLAGETTLREAAALLRYARVVVGVDTGLMHVAAAQSKPTVVIMGGGHFGRFFPYTANTTIVTKKMSCFNCSWSCPFQISHCVADVTPEQVVEAISQVFEHDAHSYHGPQRSTVSAFALSLLG